MSTLSKVKGLANIWARSLPKSTFSKSKLSFYNKAKIILIVLNLFMMVAYSNSETVIPKSPYFGAVEVIKQKMEHQRDDLKPKLILVKESEISEKILYFSRKLEAKADTKFSQNPDSEEDSSTHDKIQQIILDTKHNKHNGIKLLILLVLIALIISAWVWISKKMKAYIEKDSEMTFTQPRKGRLELYRGLQFKKFSEDPSDRINTTDLKDDNKFPKVVLEKREPSTGRNLARFEEDKPTDDFLNDESKNNFKADVKDFSHFDEEEENGIYYHNFVSNTVVGNTNIYSHGLTFNIDKKMVTRASTSCKSYEL